MKTKKNKRIFGECAICGNESEYDEETLKSSTYDINGLDIVLCCPCEDDLLKVLAKERGIKINYEDSSMSGEVVSVGFNNVVIK